MRFQFSLTQFSEVQRGKFQVDTQRGKDWRGVGRGGDKRQAVLLERDCLKEKGEGGEPEHHVPDCSFCRERADRRERIFAACGCGREADAKQGAEADHRIHSMDVWPHFYRQLPGLLGAAYWHPGVLALWNHTTSHARIHSATRLTIWTTAPAKRAGEAIRKRGIHRPKNHNPRSPAHRQADQGMEPATMPLNPAKLSSTQLNSTQTQTQPHREAWVRG